MDFDKHIDNHSFARVASSPMLDGEGRDVLVVVAKVGYLVDARGTLTLEPAAVSFVDDYDDGGGLRRPSDLADDKPGTDVGLVGTAHPRGVQPRALAWLEVAGTRHVVQLVGARSYVARRGGAEPSVPAPLQSTPLRWDLTHGGTDRSDPASIVAHAANPIGRGFARDPATLVGTPAPQIVPAEGNEDVPAGFAPIPADWEPRVSRFGTMDDAWASRRAPVWPQDARADRWCWSAPGMHRKVPLQPSFAVEVGGVRPEGPWKFVTPDYAVEMGWVLDGAPHQRRPHLDGVLIDADDGTIELTWRIAIRLPRKWQRLTRISVHSVGELSDAVLGVPPGTRVDVA